MKKYADDSPSAPDPQDSSRSASPGPNMWKSPRGGYVQAHAHHDTHISGKKDASSSGICRLFLVLIYLCLDFGKPQAIFDYLINLSLQKVSRIYYFSPTLCDYINLSVYCSILSFVQSFVVNFQLQKCFG